MEPELRQPPWPYLTQIQAAKRLGVSVDFLSGMHGHRRGGFELRAMKSATPKGNWVMLYNRADVEAIAEAMAAGQGGKR